MNNITAKITAFFTTWNKNKIIAVVATVAVFFAGAYLITTVASGFFAAVDPEQSTLSSQAKIVNDSSAIGGKAIQFTAPTTQQPPNTAGCPPFPAFPDEKCTGYKHSTGFTSESQLTPCKEGDGDEDGHFTKANAVYDKCLFKQFVRIRAANITITNSKIIGNVAPPAGHHANPYDYQGLKLIDVEITPFTDAQIAQFTAPEIANSPVPTSAQNVDPGSEGPIGDGANYSCLRCYIHHAAKSAGGGDGVKFIDSYVNSITWTEGQHGAAFGINHGVNVEIVHNNLNCYRWNDRAIGFDQGCSSALSIYDEGRLDGVLVKNNLVSTAGQYCVYTGGPTGKNVRFIDNRFDKKSYTEPGSGLGYVTFRNDKCGRAGPVHSWYPNNTGYLWQGNMWADGSGVVNP